MARKAAKRAAAAAPADDLRPRLSRHPRARRQIREAKAWAALTGFVLVGLVSLQAHVPLFDSGVRALVAGVCCYVIGWALAVMVWRHVARAEVLVRQQQLSGDGS